MKGIRSIPNRDRSPHTTWIQSAQSNASAEEEIEGITPSKLPGPEDQAGAKASMFWKRKKVVWLVILVSFGVAIVIVVITVPVVLLVDKNSSEDPSYHNQANRPIRVVDDFPDPGLVHVNGTWYAYGTNAAADNPSVAHVPVATSKNFTVWTLLPGYDVLPTLSGWETNINHYAPDVIQRVSSGRPPNQLPLTASIGGRPIRPLLLW